MGVSFGQKSYKSFQIIQISQKIFVWFVKIWKISREATPYTLKKKELTKIDEEIDGNFR